MSFVPIFPPNMTSDFKVACPFCGRMVYLRASLHMHILAEHKG